MHCLFEQLIYESILNINERGHAMNSLLLTLLFDECPSILISVVLLRLLKNRVYEGGELTGETRLHRLYTSRNRSLFWQILTAGLQNFQVFPSFI